LATNFRFSNESYSLPTRIRTGLSYSVFNENLNLALDIVKPFKEDFEYAIGIENMIMKILSLRLGFKGGFKNTNNWGGLAGGLGIRNQDIDIDYAFANSGLLSLTHSVSISYSFERSKKIRIEQEQKIVQKFQKMAKLNAQKYYTQAIDKEQAKRYDEAWEHVDISLVWDPNYKDALEYFKKADKRRFNKYLTQGYNFYKSGNYVEAASQFGYVVVWDSTNEMATGWHKATLRAYTKMLNEKIKLEGKLKSEIIDNLINGLEGFSEKDYTRAIEQWQAVLALDSTQGEAHDNITRAKTMLKADLELDISKKKWPQALKRIELLLKIEPTNEELLTKKEELKKNLKDLINTHLAEGVAFFKQKKYRLAEAKFNIVFEVDAKNLSAKHYLEKIKSLEKIEVSEIELKELHEKGIDAYTQKDYPFAIAYWQAIVKTDPHQQDAQKNIARAQSRLKIYK